MPGAPTAATYESASAADVTHDLSASTTMPAPSGAARETCAQKWLREPRSENAIVVRCSPAAIARSASAFGPSSSPVVASNVRAATTCIV